MDAGNFNNDMSNFNIAIKRMSRVMRKLPSLFDLPYFRDAAIGEALRSLDNQGLRWRWRRWEAVYVKWPWKVS